MFAAGSPLDKQLLRDSVSAGFGQLDAGTPAALDHDELVAFIL